MSSVRFEGQTGKSIGNEGGENTGEVRGNGLIIPEETLWEQTTSLDGQTL